MSAEQRKEALSLHSEADMSSSVICQSLKQLRLVTGRPKVNFFRGDAGNFTKGILCVVDLSAGITGSRSPWPVGVWLLVCSSQGRREFGNGVKHARFERSDVHRRSVMLRALLFFTYR